MKTVKKQYMFGGGSTHNRSLYQTRKNEKEKAARIKQLEAEIEAVKGTPAAKPLVEEYRRLTGQG